MSSLMGNRDRTGNGRVERGFTTVGRARWAIVEVEEKGVGGVRYN